jgi:histidyl-tRNA synthetase
MNKNIKDQILKNELLPLPGFRDFYPEEWKNIKKIFRIWSNIAKIYFFKEINPPSVEYLKTFQKKISYYDRNKFKIKTFSFKDQGGREIVLRPETTPSVIRMIELKYRILKKPVKWYSISECFRFDRPQKGRLRSFYQFNIDLFGVNNILSEIDIITMIYQILTNFGFSKKDFLIKISDRIIWNYFLKIFDIKNQTQILKIIDKKNGEDLLIKYIQKKLKYRFKELKLFLKHLKKFLKIDSINSLKKFFKHTIRYNDIPKFNFYNEIKDRIKNFSFLINNLLKLGLEKCIKIDFGIVRGLEYYNGFIFEVFPLKDNKINGRAIAGGGRYNFFSKKLGEIIPSIGFAMGDVTLNNLIFDNKKKIEKNYRRIINKKNFFFIMEDPILIFPKIYKEILFLRLKKFIVECNFNKKSINKQIKKNILNGFKNILVYKTNLFFKKKIFFIYSYPEYKKKEIRETNFFFKNLKSFFNN